LGILANPAGKSEGFDKKWKIRTGGGFYNYGNPRAWGNNVFGNSEGRGGLKYRSRLWYGMDIFWNRPMVAFDWLR